MAKIAQIIIFRFRRYSTDEENRVKEKIIDFSKKGNILTQYTAFIGVNENNTPVESEAAVDRLNPQPRYVTDNYDIVALSLVQNI